MNDELKNADEPDPIAAARALLAEDQRARMEKCAAAIEAVLARHGMRLEAAPPQIVLSPVD
jgi:hypothetical protein